MPLRNTKQPKRLFSDGILNFGADIQRSAELQDQGVGVQTSGSDEIRKRLAPVSTTQGRVPNVAGAPTSVLMGSQPAPTGGPTQPTPALYDVILPPNSDTSWVPPRNPPIVTQPPGEVDTPAPTVTRPPGEVDTASPQPTAGGASPVMTAETATMKPAAAATPTLAPTPGGEVDTAADTGPVLTPNPTYVDTPYGNTQKAALDALVRGSFAAAGGRPGFFGGGGRKF